MPNTGNLFGTTRTRQPGSSRPPELRYESTSGGVLCSLPASNGQVVAVGGGTGWRIKSVGRLARSVAIITHRPVIGSLRNSGKSLCSSGVLNENSQALIITWCFGGFV